MPYASPHAESGGTGDSVQLDHELGIKQVTEKLARTDDPRPRRMLEVVLDHMIAENEGDLERVMRSISPRAEYHVWAGPIDNGAKGVEGVRRYYEGFFSIKGHFFENDCQRILVDDDCVVTESIMRMIKPGRIMGDEPFGPDTEPLDPGEEGAFDREAHYLLEGRCLIIWPFDDELLLIGEDAYASGRLTISKLADDELPDAYRELLARS